MPNSVSFEATRQHRKEDLVLKVFTDTPCYLLNSKGPAPDHHQTPEPSPEHRGPLHWLHATSLFTKHTKAKHSKESHTGKQAVLTLLAASRRLSHRVPRGTMLSRGGQADALLFAFSFHKAASHAAAVSGSVGRGSLFPEELTFSQTAKANHSRD